MGQYLSLEPADLAGGCGGAVQGPAAHHMAHHRIDTQSFGVIHIFVAGQPTVDRLTQQRRHAVLNVAAGAEVEQLRCAGIGQVRRLIQVTVGE